MKKLFLFALTLSLLYSYSPSIVLAKDEEDKGPLSKVTFIHYAKGHKPPEIPMNIIALARSNNKKPSPATNTCYAYISSGAKWKHTENYIVNWENKFALSESDITNAFSSGANEWDKEVAFSIFGAQYSDRTANFDFNSTDDKNVVMFGNYSDPGVIAVTNVWGYFYGSPRTRELVEWDMLLNNNFKWGVVDPSNPGNSVMDLQNIATHELGHSAGMGDLYDSNCSQETMFGYGIEGETIKRDLNTGDIAGIKALYK